MEKLKIKVIVGSTREGRFSDRPAQWIAGELSKQEDVDVEVLDLRDYPMPFFDEPTSPSMREGEPENPVAREWSRKIAEADGYIVVTPEYLHSVPAVLKNAFDWIASEWNKKPIGFVSYGGVGGARAVEHLRQIASELQMVPVRSAVHIQWDVYTKIKEAGGSSLVEAFAPVAKSADGLIEQLMWWARALKASR